MKFACSSLHDASTRAIVFIHIDITKLHMGKDCFVLYARAFLFHNQDTNWFDASATDPGCVGWTLSFRFPPILHARQVCKVSGNKSPCLKTVHIEKAHDVESIHA